MKKDQRHRFNGVWIPKEILKLENITSNQKILICIIGSLSSNAERSCWANNNLFAEEMHCSPRWIQKMLATLKKLGYITIKYSSNGEYRRSSRRVSICGSLLRTFVHPENIVENNYSFKQDEKFSAVFKKWLDYCKKEGIELSESRKKSDYQNLITFSKNSPESAIIIVQTSIDKGWKGLFKLKKRPFAVGTILKPDGEDRFPELDF